MSETNPSEHGEMSRDEMMSALFAHMVIQQSNMAMMLLGKVPHPQTGEAMQDLEAAKLFIDQLEMLEAKTKGNLTPQEQQLLKQSLMSLRMAFVETVESPQAEKKISPTMEPVTPTPASEEKLVTPEEKPTAAAEDESRKKFSKKY
ncbi:MAG: hypothetical protein QOD03_820 [Verrucomicrobiota bacterium]|jgi:uncharacterized membrane protein YccC